MIRGPTALGFNTWFQRLKLRHDEMLSNQAFITNLRPHTEGGEFETKKDAQIFWNAREALRKHTAKTLKTEC